MATDPTHREGAGAGRSRFTLQHPAGGPTGNQSIGDRDGNMGAAEGVKEGEDRAHVGETSW